MTAGTITKPIQIKTDRTLMVREPPAPFTVMVGDPTVLAIDDREIPIAGAPTAPFHEVAHAVARVPAALRSVLTAVAISQVESPYSAMWAKRYRLPVRAGMGAVASGSGKVVIYPHGLEKLHVDGGDVFVRNLMHELGHCWSLRDWVASPSSKDAWLAAMVSDGQAPSIYAELSFRNSGLPYEDAAEATALYFLVAGVSAGDAYRAAMPARFGLLDARFCRS